MHISKRRIYKDNQCLYINNYMIALVQNLEDATASKVRLWCITNFGNCQRLCCNKSILYNKN